jgi:hypothetical protein
MAKNISILLSHWYTLIEGLQESPQEFYGSLEQAISKRQLTNITTSRIDYKESGVLSANREYFRVDRNEHIFDICAAPFGTGFFVSWRLGESRPSPVIPTIVAISVLSYIIYQFGFVTGLLALLGSLVVLGILISQEMIDWHPYVLVIPVIGPILERYFLPPTYYKIDTALMFQESVRRAVLEVIDEITKAKGLRVLSENERKPILSRFLLGQSFR